jgi:hypothetical protein
MVFGFAWTSPKRLPSSAVASGRTQRKAAGGELKGRLSSRNQSISVKNVYSRNPCGKLADNLHNADARAASS